MEIRKIIQNNKTILKNTSYLSIIELVRMVMPFIALPYILKTVGSEKYGTIVFVQSIIAYFSIIISFGLDISAVKNVSVNRENKSELSKIVSSVLLIKLILFLASLLILLLIVYITPFLRIHSLLFFFAFISCLSEILFPAWFFQGIEKMKNITLIRFTSILLYISFVFTFIHNERDYIFLPLLYSIAFIIPAVIGFIMLLRQEIRLSLPNTDYVIRIFKESIPFFFSRVSVVINHNIAKTLTGFSLGMSDVTAYDIAQKLINGAAIPLQMLNQAIFPHNANKRDHIFAKKILWVMIGLSGLLSMMVLLLAPTLIKVLGVENQQQCFTICKIFCLWLIAASISFYSGSPVLVAFGFPKPFNSSVIFSTVLLCILYSLIYMLNIFSVYLFAIVLVLTETFIAGYRMWYCRKYKLL